jgi:hypothetical protein
MWVLILFVIITFGLYWIIHWKHYPKNFPPGPHHFVPFIGDPLFAIGSDATAGFDLMHKKYGPIVGFNFGGRKLVSIGDLDILQKVKNIFKIQNYCILKCPFLNFFPLFSIYLLNCLTTIRLT